jgi:hypothetical protein
MAVAGQMACARIKRSPQLPGTPRIYSASAPSQNAHRPHTSLFRAGSHSRTGCSAKPIALGRAGTSCPCGATHTRSAHTGVCLGQRIARWHERSCGGRWEFHSRSNSHSRSGNGTATRQSPVNDLHFYDEFRRQQNLPRRCPRAS